MNKITLVLETDHGEKITLSGQRKLDAQGEEKSMRVVMALVDDREIDVVGNVIEEEPIEPPPTDPDPGRVTITPDDPTVKVGEILRLNAIAIDGNGEFLSVLHDTENDVWFKDDWRFGPRDGEQGSEYFIVDEFGLIKRVRQPTGEATVRAWAEHVRTGMRDDVIVTVVAATVEPEPTDPAPTDPDPIDPGPVTPTPAAGPLREMVEEIIGPVGLPADPEWQQLLGLALKWSDWQITNRLTRASSIQSFNYYDFAGILYYLSALTDDDSLAQRADAIVAEYLTTYAAKTPGNMVQPHQWQPRGVEIYVRRTGDKAARAALDLYGWKLARQLDGTATYDYVIGGSNPNMDNRQVGRSILSALAAVYSAGRADLAKKIDTGIAALEKQQVRDGGARWSYLGAQDPIFLAAILVHALGDAERRGFPDPRIAAMCDRWLDDAWKEARATRNCQGQTAVTFPYLYGGTPACYHHTLNGIYAVPYAQRYLRTKDPAHRAQVMDLVRGALVSETWDNVGKQFTEVCRAIWAAGIVAAAG